MKNHLKNSGDNKSADFLNSYNADKAGLQSFLSSFVIIIETLNKDIKDNSEVSSEDNKEHKINSALLDSCYSTIGAIDIDSLPFKKLGLTEQDKKMLKHFKTLALNDKTKLDSYKNKINAPAQNAQQLFYYKLNNNELKIPSSSAKKENNTYSAVLENYLNKLIKTDSVLHSNSKAYKDMVSNLQILIKVFKAGEQTKMNIQDSKFYSDNSNRKAYENSLKKTIEMFAGSVETYLNEKGISHKATSLGNKRIDLALELDAMAKEMESTFNKGDIYTSNQNNAVSIANLLGVHLENNAKSEESPNYSVYNDITILDDEAIENENKYIKDDIDEDFLEEEESVIFY